MKYRRFGFAQTGLLLAIFWLSFVLSGCTLNAFKQSGEAEVEALPTPSPEFSPDEVVHLQLEALQHNDKTNRGIETAFNFASPDNRKVTGPLTRFVKMVKSPPYNAMLNHRSVEYDPVEISGNTARQRVKLIGADGRTVIYIFKLSKQSAAPYKNCWMTDAVMAEPVPELPQDQA